jgi:GLPGLI family protein
LQKPLSMKFLLLAAIGALSFSNSIGQSDTSGVIDYNELITIEISTEGMDSAQAAMMAQFMPKEQKFYKQMFFDQQQSLFTQNDSITKAENEARMKKMRMDGGGNGGPMMMINMEGGQSELYIDLSNNISTEYQEFMGRDFLIEEKTETPKWKITGKQKSILNYMCIEATATIDSSLVTAWFTPQIKNSIGPNGLNGLPGAILEANMGSSNVHYTATKVTLKPLAKNSIQRPTVGKKVTREEFEKIVLDKQKEMEDQYGKSSGHHITIKTK